MKLYRYLLTLAAFVMLCSTNVLLADEQDHSRFDEELNERDFDALRDFLKARKTVDVTEASRTSNLVFSGDVRTEYRHMNEHCKGKVLRGHKGEDILGRKVSRNDFDIEFNLFFNYVFNDRSWAVAHVRYDNSAGVDDNGHPCSFPDDITTGTCCRDQALDCIGDPQGYHGSGNCDDLCLKKAYMGFNLYKCGCNRIDLELGRRGNLYNVFDSNVQFLSRFDGILLKYDNTCPDFADWYVHAAAFVVDERVNHFAWVMEYGLMDIMDQDIDFKYSFIDWHKNGENRCFTRNPRGFRFQNSQFLLAYHIDPELVGGYPIKLFAAFLVNHAADDLRFTKTRIVDGEEIVTRHNEGHQNLAWYAGILIGEVDKEGDWAIELQYQAVQAQAMPDDDCSGICRGNILDESFTTCSLRGNTNFHGFRLEGLYAFTDNMTLDTIIECSWALNNKIGGTHYFSKLELEAVYAF